MWSTIGGSNQGGPRRAEGEPEGEGVSRFVEWRHDDGEQDQTVEGQGGYALGRSVELLRIPDVEPLLLQRRVLVPARHLAQRSYLVLALGRHNTVLAFYSNALEHALVQVQVGSKD